MPWLCNGLAGVTLIIYVLSLLVNAMLKHGITPDSMIVGTMMPIPKCKYKELANPDNYQSIALSSVMGKHLNSSLYIMIRKH